VHVQVSALGISYS